MPDSDGYPVDAELDRIATWPVDDPHGWFAFIKSCWWEAGWGWSEYNGLDDFKKHHRFFSISTGGWSGNESILEAMRKNLLWSLMWVDHRRGGHYRFAVPVKEAPDAR